MSTNTKSTRNENTSSSSVASASREDVDNENEDKSKNIGISEIGGRNEKKTTKANDDDEDAQPTTITSWREKIKISIARSRKIRGGNYVQIATVDPQTLEPRCRTVVFRGFLREMDQPKEEEEGYVMKMITDLRSKKVTEASSSPGKSNNNNVELVWWFSKSSEQYRIRGKLEYIGDPKSSKIQLPPPQTADDDDHDDATVRYWSEQRKQQWGNLSDLAREQFYWVDPGIPYDNAEGNDNDSIAIPTGGRGENGKVLEPPENFLLMILRPTYVDYLRLGDNFRQIDKLVMSDETEEVKSVDDDGSTEVRKKWICERVNP